MSGKVNDITGQVFGSLTAIQHTETKNGMAYWDYQCVCGNTHNARASTVKYELRKNDPDLPSCGCIELARKTTHGYRSVKNTHPCYRAYRSMMSRCYDPNLPEYKWYGAKGVTVCEEWRGNPEAFIKWSLNNGWKPKYHIDKDMKSGPTKIYSPDTCQWITAKENVGFATNRDNFGSHPNIKLNHSDVESIVEKRIQGRSINSLAKEYSVVWKSIRKILDKQGVD